MKFIKNSIIAIVLITGLQGCYTILWSPDMEFPNQNNSTYIYDNSFYYYDYDYYYNYPWWFRVTPPVMVIDQSSERSGSDQSLRNHEGGRRSEGTREIITPGTPSRTSGSGSTTTGTSGNDNSSGRSSSDDSRNSDTRNNDSGRNTDKGKR